MNDIQQRLFAIISKFYSPKIPVSLDLTLKDDLKLDSLSFTELVVACEDEFGIEIDMDHPDTQAASTVGDLYSGIQRLISTN
jgi:acyl carrier protein